MIAVAASVTWLAVETVVSGYGLICVARALTGKDFYAPRQLQRIQSHS